MKAALGPFVFYILRKLERPLPVEILYCVLKPFARLRAAMERPVAWPPMPACLVPTDLPGPARPGRMSFHLNRALEFFPDQLVLLKWQSRCRYR